MTLRRYVALFWIATFGFSLSTLVFVNDHFGRISPGRQIARYGELPFRDFFDPGYFLTEFSSAAVQYLFGDNLLGELLLNASFIATGSAFVFVLARRISGSLVIGALAAAASVLAMPRAYDYDKVLFYSFGVWLCWRYIDDAHVRRVIAVGLGIAAAALFRYDNGLYIGAAAGVAILAIRGRNWRLVARDSGVLAVTIMVAVLPALLFVGLNGGLGNAIDQMITYGVREAEPLQIVVFDPAPPPGSRINVRWVAGIDEAARRQFASRHQLRREVQQGAAEDRTFSYELADTSEQAIRSIVSDPNIEDTHRIDREHFRLIREPLDLRLRRMIPFLRMHMRPDMYETRSGAALYYIMMALPLIAAIALIAWRPPRADAARMWSLVVLCALLDLFILRAPMAARLGGMAGPPTVLFTWLIWRSCDSRVVVRAAAAALLVVTVWSLSNVGEWAARLRPDMRSLARLAQKLTDAAASPPDPMRFEIHRIAGIARYVRECTTPADRVFASWFAPDLFFFSQRPFAGRMTAVWDSHWSETRFQQQSIQALTAQSVPLAIIDVRTEATFSGAHPLLAAYLRTAYVTAGESDFGDASVQPPGYRVLIRKGRRPLRAHPDWALPCFA